jgi:hypothetical protein
VGQYIKVGGQAKATQRFLCSRGLCCGGVYFGTLCGGLDCDVESHRGQLGDVVADLASGHDAAGVVVGSEVVEPGGGIGEQLPGDDQDGAGDRYRGFEFAAAFGDAPVAFTEEGVGLGGRGGGLAAAMILCAARGPIPGISSRRSMTLGAQWTPVTGRTRVPSPLSGSLPLVSRSASMPAPGPVPGPL